MKPRYLEIEGLQSFKELQRIDFDKLSETGLFGIFGPTGSGKSTILDAITLALYGSVQRAVKGTQGIINTDMNGIKVTFGFELVKEGIRKAYRVERQYKRKKDSENSAEGKLARLIETAGDQEIILADRHSDVNNCVVQLLGLKFEDFTRSVVLPQNKFQEFLLAPRSEKTKMLERIFYLEEYGKQLGDKLSRQLAAARNKLSNIEGALSTLGDASPEALIECERKMTEAQEHRATSGAKLKLAQESYEKGLERYKLSKEYIALVQQLEEHNSRLPELQRLKELCVKSEAANSIRPILDEYKTAKAGLEQAAAKLTDIEKQLQSVKKEKDTVELHYSAAQAQKDQVLPELIKYTTLLQECQTLQQEAELLGIQLNAARKEYAEVNKQLEAARKLYEEKNKQREQISKELQAIDHELEQLSINGDYRKGLTQGADLEKELQGLASNLSKQRGKCSELQKETEAHQLAHNKALEIMAKEQLALDKAKAAKAQLESIKPLGRDEILQKNNRLLHIENQLQNMLTTHKALTELDNKIKQYAVEQQAIQVRLQELEQEYTSSLELKQQLGEQIKALQLQQNQHAAAMLAKTLATGESCPVCGSIEHPNPAAVYQDHESIQQEQKLEELQKQLEKQEQQQRELEHQQIKLKQQLTSAVQQQQELLAEQQNKAAEYQQHIQTLPQELIALKHEQIKEYIAAQKLIMDKAATDYQQWESSLEQQQELIKLTEAALSEAKVQEGKYAALLANSQKNIEKEKQLLQEVEAAYQVCAVKHRELLQHMKLESFAAGTAAAAAKDEKTHELREMLKKQRAQSDALAIELQADLEKINKISELAAQRILEGKKLKEQTDEKNKKVTDLIGSKSLNEELEKAQKAIEQLNRLNQALEELQRQKAALQSSRLYFEQKEKTDGSKLTEALLSKGFQDEAAAAACMLDQATFTAYQNKINQAQRERTSLEDRQLEITKQLNGKLMEEQEWKQICSDYDFIKADLELSISQYEAAKNTYQQIKNSFERWIKLQEELKTLSTRKDMLDQLQKLLKGNAFIEFISEERMRYIAREASETLGELTKFRYSLELDAENGFVIRDDANGGVLRGVASLSGGETFLTSLSLALALSSQLQLKGQSPLEFFFLDEGFGTLDNTLLDTVIDSLERLSSKQRIIGLISHVPEMKNRISRRLIITAPDPAGSGSQINIEKA